MMLHRIAARLADGRRRRRRAALRHVLSVQPLEGRLVLSLAVPAFSSLPGASHTIYLDFDGHVTTGTSWNTYDFDGDGNVAEHSTITSPAYNTDADALNFSAGELADVEDAWNRVAEDYFPFAVNVTTIDPGVEALRKSGAGDTQWGIRVVVTADTEGSRAGGIAWIDSFNWNSDTPAFVYNTGGRYAAEAASHEAGHSLGLSHDGLTGGPTYYSGHGSGETSWAPIMGVGYYSTVTTWDRGEYAGSNNAGTGANYGKGPDDLAIIGSYNGFGARPDDHADGLAGASPLAASGPALSGAGFIGTRSDVDAFSFVTGAGAVSLTLTPFAPGPNVDLLARLYDASGALIATANPAATLGATLAADLAAGQYFVTVDGTGVGNPGVSPPSGYTDYASIGRYSIRGTRVDAPATPTLAIGDVTVLESAGVAVFSVTLVGDPSAPVTVAFATSDGTAIAGADYGATAGTLTFNTAGTQTVTVPLVNDATSEPSETFSVGLSGAAGAVLADGLGVATIADDDVAPTVRIEALDVTRAEGTGTTGTPFRFRVTRTGPTTAAVSLGFATSGGSGKSFASGDDFAAGAFPGGTVTIPAGASSADLVVLVRADGTKESNEKFRVTLSGVPAGVTLTTAAAESTIVNDDGGKPGNAGKGAAAADGLSHEEAEAAGLIPCALPRPVDVDRLLADHDHDHARETDRAPASHRAEPAAAPRRPSWNGLIAPTETAGQAAPPTHGRARGRGPRR
jgi:hypothetical protein